MARAQNPNFQILEIAVEKLGPLVDELVFLGGCATALLFTDSGAPPVRATRDVDVITEVGSLAEYHRLGDRLRDRGFQEDHSAGAQISAGWVTVFFWMSCPRIPRFWDSPIDGMQKLSKRHNDMRLTAAARFG